MKKYYFACKTFLLLCFICLVCNGSVDSKLLQENQDKSLATNQSNYVYLPEEVDVKAVVNRKTAGHPSGRSCNDSEGRVSLRLILHSSGKVTDVEVLESSRCKRFQSAAIKLAWKLKFTPAKKDGMVVSQYQKLEYDYSVHDAIM